MKKISLDDVKKMEPLSDERLKEIDDFPEDFSDEEAPSLTDEQLSKFEKARSLHPEWYKPVKTTITIRLDKDVVEKYKSMGKGYQTRINADLRKALNLD